MPIRQLDLGKAYTQAAQVRDAEMVNRINEMKLADYERKAGREQQKRNIFAQYLTPKQPTGQPPVPTGQPQVSGAMPTDQTLTGMPTKPAIDYSGAATALMRGGFTEEGMEMSKYGTEMRQAEADILKAHAEAGSKEQENIRKKDVVPGENSGAGNGGIAAISTDSIGQAKNDE